ncbi:7-cyano-7-deazaguanine synthase [Streptomyces sp. NPDC051776]|uniref:7-cyano-7-deazaguanine synthase n=1 Tax=Streptomyces sp. NPDC051776 TaxID=3155414 RepID=UPI0034439EE6
MEEVALLASGGLDSCVLIADLAKRTRVHPVYVMFGLTWEPAERAALERFLPALNSDAVEPLTLLEVPAATVYCDHWSLTGQGVPDAQTSDAAVLLPGRNVLMLAVTAVWCSLRDIHTIAMGTLSATPFADATPEFFRDYARCLGAGLAPHHIKINTPYRDRTKADVIAEFPDLPLHLTLTCLAPTSDAHGPLHCGACNKCAERKLAFEQADVNDPTRYAIRERP